MRERDRRADARGRDARLRTVLETMLDQGERISARGVLKHLPDVRAPSSLTRDPVRRRMLEEFRRLQTARNAWVERAKKQSTARLERLLAERDARVADLEHQLQLLVASHRAMVQVVGELGGLPVWKKAFEGYERRFDELKRLRAMAPPTRTAPSARVYAAKRPARSLSGGNATVPPANGGRRDARGSRGPLSSRARSDDDE